jgi:hypothetical protein
MTFWNAASRVKEDGTVMCSTSVITPDFPVASIRALIAHSFSIGSKTR